MHRANNSEIVHYWPIVKHFYLVDPIFTCHDFAHTDMALTKFIGQFGCFWFKRRKMALKT